MARSDAARPDISFVVIGCDAARTLPRCLRSAREANLDGLAHELVYVDCGSRDNSVALAEAADCDHVLRGERGRFAQCRNLGLARARGRFIQFLDGDMAVHPNWVKAGVDLLEARPGVAVVWGQLHEARPNRLDRALGLDWEVPEGPSPYCGSAALFRREPLETAGGFPEDVAHGAEAYLCWRIRNAQGREVWHLHRAMAHHDADYGGLRNYVRRNVRCGEAFAEIALRCRHSEDRLWLRETAGNLAWGVLLLAALAALLFGGETLRLTGVAFLAAAFGRKFFQYLLKGRRPLVSARYALHTYATKLLVAWGILRHLLTPRGSAR